MKEFFDSKQDLERLNLINSETINFLLFDWFSQVLGRALLFWKRFSYRPIFSLAEIFLCWREIFSKVISENFDKNFNIFTWKIMHLSGFEPETSRVWSERDYHYTTGARPPEDLFDILN